MLRNAPEVFRYFALNGLILLSKGSKNNMTLTLEKEVYNDGNRDITCCKMDANGFFVTYFNEVKSHFITSHYKRQSYALKTNAKFKKPLFLALEGCISW